jgi:hypothetical protein
MTIEELLEAVRLAERSARQARNLPLSHVLSFSEFPFAFALDAVEQFDRATESAFQKHPQIAPLRAMAMLAKKDYARANAIIEAHQKAKPHYPMGNMRFGLEPAESKAPLPPVSGAYPKDTALFLSCSGKYFHAFCAPLLSSILANSPRTRLHIHLMDANAPKIAEVLARSPLDISITHEDTGGGGRDYYGAVRLIRFAEALEENAGQLWMADVDSLVMGDVGQLFAIEAPAALRVRPGRLEPWNQFSACLVMGTKASLPYYRAVANIIRGSLDRLWWGMDQYALFSAWTALKPEIQLLGPDVAAVEADKPGLFWFTAGGQKATLKDEETEYAKAFKRFSS